MKKIAIIGNNSIGLYKFRGELISKLVETGYEVIALIPFDSNIDDLKSLGIMLFDTPIDRRGLNPVKDLSLLRLYKEILDREKPDLVITYTIKPNIYGGFLCRLKKLPYVINITGLGTVFQNNGILRKIVTVMYKFAFKKAKVGFFENVENRDFMVKNRIIPAGIAYCLNGAGVNLDEYKFEEYPENEKNHFLFIGRVMKEKGIDELFKVAKRLKNENANVAIDIVGWLEDDYEKTVTDLDRNDVINYYGFKNDVRPFIKRSHCFVLPSYHEGMANTLLECGAMGRPLITSNIHGCLEAVVDGKTGFLCNVKDSDDLYDKMIKFIELPYEKKCEMGKLSHDYIAEKFDKKKVVDETVKILLG